MRYNSYSMLGQIVQGALRQAEQAIQTGRLNPMQSQQRNEQIFRGAPNNAAPVAERGQRQAGAVVSSPRPDSRTDAAEAARTADAGSNAGPAATASVPIHRKAPDNYEKLLKVNFSEENLLSGIIMAEVLGKPKCLRRGRW